MQPKYTLFKKQNVQAKHIKYYQPKCWYEALIQETFDSDLDVFVR